MISEWKRVSVRQWTPTSNVHVQWVDREPKEFKAIPQQMLHNLIGVTVPVTHPQGIVVIPLEYMAGNKGQYGWRRCDPMRRYLVVPERWVSELGDAYDEEVRLARKAMRVHRLSADDPDTLRLHRLKARLRRSLQEFVLENQEADERKKHLRKRRYSK